MTNHTQHHWQPAPQHDNGQWKGPDGYKDAHGNTYDSGHWKGFDGYKDASGKPYDSGHWKGHDAYPPHNHQHHDQGHWQPGHVMRDQQGNVLQPGEFSTLPLPNDHGAHQGRWQQDGPAQMRDEQGNVLQPGEFSTLPLPGQVQMRDEQGNVLQPGEFSTLPVPDHFADHGRFSDHEWRGGADQHASHAQQDVGGHIVHNGADFFTTPDGQVGGASSVSWEPSAGVGAGDQVAIMAPSTLG